MTDGRRIEGGTGWYIDGETLLPTIEDYEMFRNAHAGDPAVDILVALWTGQPHDAERQLHLKLAESDSPRWRALLADAWRDQGRTDAAIATYHELVEGVAGTAREAVMQQHLGKAYFVAGRYVEAAHAFERAVNIRMRAGADEELIKSSQMALARAARSTTRALIRSTVT